MALFKRAQVSVLPGEPEHGSQFEIVRKRADATTRKLIASEQLFRSFQAHSQDFPSFLGHQKEISYASEHPLMKITSGVRLGPYEIVAPIGTGGMGEVYRARDTRLGRTVAIKMLPAKVAGDARLRLRLEREAKIISALNHPHICALYDVGDDYLVMEYCEGKSLAARILAGPLPIEQVLQFGVEIAEALDGAHRSGIVHRDLKPSNIMLTKSGVKLLDFGLANTTAPILEGEASSTKSFADSRTGKFAGTVQYMAPEVLSGKEADARSDLFALGLILYEMVTGKPAFSGDSTATLIAAILREEPRPIREFQPVIPLALDHVIRKCLSKDPEDRWQSAHDVAAELKWVTEVRSQGAVIGAVARRETRTWLFLGMAAILAATAVIASWTWRRTSRQQRPIARTVIPLQPGSTLSGAGGPFLAISPDGRKLVYSAVANQTLSLYLRYIDRFDAVPIAGTEGGAIPFFSPDGEWIAFFVGPQLKKVPLSGGTPQTLASVAGPGRGGTWSKDGTIYFCPGPSFGLWKVSITNPKPEPLTMPDSARGENGHRWPQILPDGKHILFTIRTDRISSFDEAKIAVLSLQTGKWHVVFEGGSNARYLPTGHIVFAQRGTLYAIRFDLGSLTVRGSPVPAVHEVITFDPTGAAQYAVAEQTGTLVYIPGASRPPKRTLLIVDRMGKQTGALAIDQRVDSFRVSPDQKRLALQVAAANDDIWTYELERGTLTRISFVRGDEWWPTWTADGKKILYGSNRILWWQSADGSGAAEELARGPDIGPATSSPDGRLVVYPTRTSLTKQDLWLLSLGQDGTPRPLLRTPFAESQPVFSPDGRWIAYTSDASGTPEIYLRSIVDSDRQWQVSTGGGSSARWSRDGRELFYRFRDGFYAASITLGDVPAIGKPRLLFTLPEIAYYDVFGSGFLLNPRHQELNDISAFHVVSDWFGEVRARVGG